MTDRRDDADDTAKLRSELEGLRRHVDELHRERDSVAQANVHAALKLAEISDARTREAEQRRKELEEALALARSASRKKDEFLSNVSHELRTPLNGIVGMLTLLLDSALDREQRHCVRTALRASHGLVDLIEDLLSVTRLAGANVQAEEREIDLWRLCEDVLRLSATSASSRVRVVVRIAPAVPRRVVSDPKLLKQVLSNLIGNAVKFTEQGFVRLAVDVEPLRAVGGPARVSFRVEDSGCGIPANELSTIFETFSQVDGSDTRRHGGTGLGLTIARSLVDLLGGELTVQSDEGVGSAFAFRLELPPAGAPPIAKVHGSTFLIASATPHHTPSLREHLKALGAEVVSAACLDSDPAGTLDREFDCLVLDETTPLPDAVAARIAKARARLRVALIARTSTRSAAEPDAWRCLRAPLSPSEIVDLAAAVAEEMHSYVVPSAQPSAVEDLKRRMDEGAASVLVVEDNPVNQAVAKGILKRLGCSVTVAGGGREAIRLTEANAYDLILMDCQMPDVDGYDATHAIRQRESGLPTRIPIHALTANVSDQNHRRCLSVGMDGLLGKPIDVELLARTILEACCSRRRAG